MRRNASPIEIGIVLTGHNYSRRWYRREQDAQLLLTRAKDEAANTWRDVPNPSLAIINRLGIMFFLMGVTVFMAICCILADILQEAFGGKQWETVFLALTGV